HPRSPAEGPGPDRERRGLHPYQRGPAGRTGGRGPSGDRGSPQQPGSPRGVPSPIAAGPDLRWADHRAGRLRLPPGTRGRRPHDQDPKRSLPSMIKKKAGAKKPTAAPLRGSFGELDFEAVRELARIASEFD